MNFTDQLNRTIELRSFPPTRIISVVPSQTELLFDLGLDEEVIGITKFCIHPEQWFRSKKRIGGTKQLNVSVISELSPDLIIANKEENEELQIRQLEKEFPVWISDIKNLDDAYEMIKQVGELVGRSGESVSLISTIRQSFLDDLSPIHLSAKTKALYVIWKDPYMSVGADTFISDMMRRCGFENILKSKQRYPEMSTAELSTLDCQLVMLSSEPYPFKEKHVIEIQQLLPKAKVILVDGEMFSWYGSRLQLAPAYFSELRRVVFNR
jgi:ABC-type Fe3+-hydroxamate transport system substrate-binding protein